MEESMYFLYSASPMMFYNVIWEKSMDLAGFEPAASTCFVDAPVGDENAKVAIYQSDP